MTHATAQDATLDHRDLSTTASPGRGSDWFSSVVRRFLSPANSAIAERPAAARWYETPDAGRGF
jgi:hypothetical protein